MYYLKNHIFVYLTFLVYFTFFFYLLCYILDYLSDNSSVLTIY